MSEVQLTASMRSNLLALQQTTELLGKTQERLSSGKKVNSALDNPTNFFAAQSLTARANDLLGFKDAISQAIQTINAADKSITAIKSLIASAKAVANDAKSAVGTAFSNEALTIAGTVTAGTVVTIGGTALTAITTGTATAAQFLVGSTTTETATNLATAIAANTTIAASYAASGSGDVVTVVARSGDLTAGQITSDGTLITDAAPVAHSATALTELQAKFTSYNSLMTQLGNLQDDAFYSGKNLLNNETLTVKFGNSKTLDVSGFSATVAGLSMSASASATSWGNDSEIDADITLMDSALDKLKVESGKLASNLSIVNARDQWITDISNVLQTGADKLTLADSNEEGANMLMLQTRQALGVTSLSLASQQAQSVLRLFG